jgi:hypothetical protein
VPIQAKAVKPRRAPESVIRIPRQFKPVGRIKEQRDRSGYPGRLVDPLRLIPLPWMIRYSELLFSVATAVR